MFVAFKFISNIGFKVTLFNMDSMYVNIYVWLGLFYMYLLHFLRETNPQCAAALDTCTCEITLQRVRVSRRDRYGPTRH